MPDLPECEPMSSALTAPLFIAAIALLALASYGVTRWALSNRIDAETRELAGSVLFRIASLHGLVLALVFAQDLAGIRDVAISAEREATLVSDIFHDAERYGGDDPNAVMGAMARYGRIVATEEWPLLAAEGRLSPAAWTEWEVAYEALLGASPSTPRQQRLLDVMLKDVRELSALRDLRENTAMAGNSPLFLWAALVGVVLISAAYFTWPATAVNLGLIAVFAGFTGLILYMIVNFSNPFAAPGQATATGFVRFLTPDVLAIAARPTEG